MKCVQNNSKIGATLHVFWGWFSAGRKLHFIKTMNPDLGYTLHSTYLKPLLLCWENTAFRENPELDTESHTSKALVTMLGKP